MKTFILLALALSIPSAFAKDSSDDLISCASKDMSYELGRMFDFIEEGDQIVPLFNAKQEVVGFMGASQDEDNGSWSLNGIQLCGNFSMTSFYYNEDGSDLPKNWATTRGKKMRINQDEGVFRFTAKAFSSKKFASSSKTQLVRVEFEATDITASDDGEELVVGKGEFFVLFPKSWLK